MGYNDIFHMKEEQYYLKNRKCFKEFLTIFQHETGLNWKNIVARTDIPANDYCRLFYFVRHTIIMNCPKYIPIFF